MKINTTAAKYMTKNNKTYYTVSVKASWLKMPICYFKDVLVINHTGIYDDSYNEYGYFIEKISCCASTKTFKYESTRNGSISSNVTFDYPSVSTVATRFNLLAPTAYTCTSSVSSHTRIISSIDAYLRYRIILTPGSTVNVQGAYCHKQVSVGSIGISVTSGSISFSLAGSKKEYKATPITFTA